MLSDYASHRLARMLRSTRRGEGAALTYVTSAAGGGPHPDGKRTFPRGSRINDGYSWVLAAWAEILDRSPLFTCQASAGSRERVTISPWRNGKVSAWAYLDETALDPIMGGSAKQMLADLERRGVIRAGEVTQ